MHMKYTSPGERIKQAEKEASDTRRAENTRELDTSKALKKQIFEALDILNEQGPTHKIEVLYDAIDPSGVIMKALARKVLSPNSFTLGEYTGTNYSGKRVHVGRTVDGWVMPNIFSTTTTPPSGPYTTWSHLVVSTDGDFWEGGVKSVGGEGLIYGIEGDPFLSRRGPRQSVANKKLGLTLEAMQTLATNP